MKTYKPRNRNERTQEALSDHIIELIAERINQGFGSFAEVVRSGFVHQAMIREAQAKALRAYADYVDELHANPCGFEPERWGALPSTSQHGNCRP